MADATTAGAPGTELRLALAMRGGVSLAVWIGGACGEIDELRRGEVPFWSDLTKACGYEKVAVDVLAGASAGGLNGVMFASALRHGFKMVDLRGLWGSLASVSELRRSGKPWLSLFDGDSKFLDPLHTSLSELVSDSRGADGAYPSADYIDLQLTATMVEPLKIPSRCLPDEEIWRQRSEAMFHFRHESRGVAPRRDLEGDDDALWRLAVAARATSSFPVAFEAALVRSRRPTSFGAPLAHEGRDLVDCRGVFSESRTPTGSGADATESDFVVADGGIVDNIPIGRTISAISAAPASGPTKRALIYLHPTGPPAPPGPAGNTLLIAVPQEASPSERQEARRGVKSVLRGLWSAKVQTESIDGDLEQLEEHNRAVFATRLLRRSALEGTHQMEMDPGVICNASSFSLVWSTYIDQRSASDGAAVRRLLDDPLAVLGHDPFPSSGVENRWRAPLFDWGDDARLQLNDGIILAYREQLGASGPTRMFTTDISALHRVIDLLLEWVRAQPPSDSTADAKASLYRLRSLVAAIREIRQLAWVVLTRSAPEDVTEWAKEALAAVDRLTDVPVQLADSTVQDLGDAGEYLDYANAVLNSAVEQDLGPVDPLVAFPTPDSAVDLRLRIEQALISKVGLLLGSADLSPMPDDHPAALLHHLLTWSSDQLLYEPSTADRLISLEIEGLREETAGGIAGEKTTLFRISATAETPLAAEFKALHKESLRLDDVHHDGWVGREDFLRPEVKLAGNELANFSAFLDRRWRDNDWMWGRLDAASDLIALMLKTSDLSDVTPVSEEIRTLAGVEADADFEDVRNGLIGERQRQILAELLQNSNDRACLATYSLGLETPTRHGGRLIQRNIRRIVKDSFRVFRHALRSPLALVLVPLGTIGQLIAGWLTRPRRGLKPTDRFIPTSDQPD